MDQLRPKVGRPPKRALPGDRPTLTIRLSVDEKNLLVEQADAYDMTITEYLMSLVRRDAS
jgi:uncharacterized protein (DUF1778 family)